MTERGKLMSFEAGEEKPHTHADVYELEFGEKRDRLVIAASAAHVSLLCELVDCLEGELYVLYVLTASRGEAEMGRYESPALGHDEVKAFLRRFEAFFEGDGRHDVWVGSIAGSGLLVYDRHDLIHAYGPLDRIRQVVERRGLTQGPVEVPTPHSHWFLPEFDEAQADLLAHWSWQQFPLRDQDLED